MHMKTGRYLVPFVFFLYFIYGSIESLRAATLSTLIVEEDLSFLIGGVIVTAFYIGYTSSNLIFGYISEKRGHTVVVMTGIISFFAGTLFYASGRQLLLLFGSFLTGLAAGTFAVSASALILESSSDNKGRNINWTTLFHSVGATIVPLVSAFVINRTGSWRVAYLLMLPLTIAAFFIGSFILPRKKKDMRSNDLASQKKNVSGEHRLFQILTNEKAVALNLMVFAYVAGEAGIITWMRAYMLFVKDCSEEYASVCLSAFFLLLMAGRFFGGILVDRLGFAKSIITVGVCAIACVTGAVMLPDGFAFLLPLTGLFCAIIFPTGVAATTETLAGVSGQAIGIYCACGGLGGVFGGWIMGYCADNAGLDRVMLLCAGLFVIVVLSMFFFMRQKGHSI